MSEPCSFSLPTQAPLLPRPALPTPVHEQDTRAQNHAADTRVVDTHTHTHTHRLCHGVAVSAHPGVVVTRENRRSWGLAAKHKQWRPGALPRQWGAAGGGLLPPGGQNRRSSSAEHARRVLSVVRDRGTDDDNACYATRAHVYPATSHRTDPLASCLADQSSPTLTSSYLRAGRSYPGTLSHRKPSTRARRPRGRARSLLLLP